MTAPPIKNKKKLGCMKKRRYPDEMAARAAGIFSLEHQPCPTGLYVCKCKVCNGWHLTKQSNGKEKRVRVH